jgi:hemolysin III
MVQDEGENPTRPAQPGMHSLYFSPAEDRANVLTHGIGFMLSLLVLPLFWERAASTPVGFRVCCFVFVVCMATVYLFSTLSHAYQHPKLRNCLRAWDQGTIYLLIVGTYSPFIWQGSQGSFRVLFFLLVWGVALMGFFAKVIVQHRINAVSTITYLGLGWIPAMPLIKTTPSICFAWMLFGGLSYTLGIPLLLKSNQWPYSHTAWHLMVMLGSACHCVAIYLLIRAAA